jgi:alpha-amylase
VLDINRSADYFDDRLNGEIMGKVAEKCYLPANRLLAELVDRFDGRFKVSFSVTGVVIEQARRFRPDVLESFRNLARQGGTEFLGETYYHSISSLFDAEEFLTQVRLHQAIMKAEFGVAPSVFRNTELIYSDHISDLVAEMPEYRIVLTEGAERVLRGRSPLYAYRAQNRRHLLLLKYYSLSDDVAFRFSDKSWAEYPLAVDKFVDWILKLKLLEKGDKSLYLNLFMDYETFGEHQWSDTGIFDFLSRLPETVLRHPDVDFAWPSEAVDSLNYDPATLGVADPISWADTERDLSAWLGNPMQWNASNTFYSILKRIRLAGRADLLEVARHFSTSDHFYYMSRKYFQDGDVHKYFSPYRSPEDAYTYYMNALADIERRLEEKQ